MIPPTTQSKMEKQMENETETGGLQGRMGCMGFRVEKVSA